MRRWQRRPVFALTVIVTLGAGIGATTAMFSIVDAVLLRPLPWPDSDRIVVVHAVDPSRRTKPSLAAQWDRAPLSWFEWRQLHQSPAFEHFAIWSASPPEFGQAFGRARDSIISVMYTCSTLLPLFGVQPAMGRNFTKQEDETEETKTAIISHEMWQKFYSGGRTFLTSRCVLGPV